MIDDARGVGGQATDLRRGRRPGRSVTGDPVDRFPPHSIEAEQGVIGCIFLSPHECVPECIEKLKAGAQCFYDLRHQVLFELLVEMYDRKEAIDVITVQQWLKDKQQLEQVGGVAYLASLPDTVPSAANLSFYVNIVREKFILRKCIRHCTDIVASVYEHTGDVDELLDEVESGLMEISDDRVVTSGAPPIKDLVCKAINKLEQYHQNAGALTGIGTGFVDFDKLTSGLHGGEMIVIAARPSMGKSSWLMNVAEHVAIDLKLPVGIFSLEMSSESLVMRTICSRGRVNLRNVREGFFTERDFPKITVAAGKLAHSSLYIDDTPGLSILQLRSKARRMQQQHGIKLFGIDYLQLLHSHRRRENRQQEIADISNGVKELAKELDVPVIVLSQLNREMERDKSRKPRMSDLRESGAIEQDADLIGLLYKPQNDESDSDNGYEQEAVPINLLIAKHRNGATGNINLTFLKIFTRFESAAKISDGNLP